MKSGFITKQLFEERRRNYESADAAVQNMTARRDQAKSAIKFAEAKVQEIESMIQISLSYPPGTDRFSIRWREKGRPSRSANRS